MLYSIPENNYRLDVVEGRRYAMLLTGFPVGSVVKIQFRHNATWFDHPDFIGTPAAGVISGNILLGCPFIRVNFSIAPTPEAPAFISITEVTAATS